MILVFDNRQSLSLERIVLLQLVYLQFIMNRDMNNIVSLYVFNTYIERMHRLLCMLQISSFYCLLLVYVLFVSVTSIDYSAGYETGDVINKNLEFIFNAAIFCLKALSWMTIHSGFGGISRYVLRSQKINNLSLIHKYNSNVIVLCCISATK